MAVLKSLLSVISGLSKAFSLPLFFFSLYELHFPVFFLQTLWYFVENYVKIIFCSNSGYRILLPRAGPVIRCSLVSKCRLDALFQGVHPWQGSLGTEALGMRTPASDDRRLARLSWLSFLLVPVCLSASAAITPSFQSPLIVRWLFYHFWQCPGA